MRLAEPHDIESLVRHYTEAAIYAHSVGHIDWEIPFPIETIAEFVRSKELFCLQDESATLQASVLLTDNADTRIWESDGGHNFTYVSKLATATAIHGTGYARRQVFPSIVAHARSYQHVGVRLDCLADNPRLRHYYERLGFASLGGVTFYSSRQRKLLSVARYEMKF